MQQVDSRAAPPLPAPHGSAIWEWDLETGTERYSAAAAALILGPGQSQAIDKARWLQSLHPEDAGRVGAAFERAIRENEARWELSYRVLAADGVTRHIRDRGFIVRSQGAVVRVLGDLREEQGSRAGEDPSPGSALEERVQLYKAIVDFIPQLCWAADTSGWIDFYNRGWFEYTGTTIASMAGWGWVDVHDPLDLARMLRTWRHALATGEPWEDEFRLRRGSDGMLRWHLSRAMPLRDGEGRIVRWFGTNTDVHEQKLASREYSRLLVSEQHLRREAEAANRAKDEFLAVVSHELRTPLSVIQNCASLLRAGVPQDKHPVLFERIERNALQQTKLVSDLIDVSRIIAGKLLIEQSPVDLAEVARRAVEELQPLAKKKGVALSSVQVEGARPATVRGDAERLAQVVGNLVNNALKFTPNGKAVEVRVVSGEASVEVAVRDEGIGIGAESLPRLFHRFVQVDGSSTRRHGGMGLGLSIVRELLELQQGEAFAHSDGPGLGATFTIRLPRLNDAQVVHPAEERVLATPVPLTGVRLLVVDDEPDVRVTLADMLLSCGATVTVVGSVREALAAFRLGAPDVVLSDLAMPDEDGYALIALIRAMAPPVGGTPAIALTAYASRLDQERALQAGFDGFATKPVDAPLLSRKISELLRDKVLAPRGENQSGA